MVAGFHLLILVTICKGNSMLYHFVLINGCGLNIVWQLVSGFDHGMYSLWKSSHGCSLESKVIMVRSLSFAQPEELTCQNWFSHTPFILPFSAFLPMCPLTSVLSGTIVVHLKESVLSEFNT
jgi:hypothetical protein